MTRVEMVQQFKKETNGPICHTSADDGTLTDELFEFFHEELISYNCRTWHGRVIKLTEEEKQTISSGEWKKGE